MKQIFLKSFCARCLTLLVLALLSTNLAWGDEVTFGSDWNSLFGTSYSGTISSVKANSLTLSGTISGVSIEVKNGSSTNGYVKTGDFRAYNGYTIKFTAPTGGNITAISSTVGGKNFSSGISANVGTLSISNNTISWSGSTNEVTLTCSGTVSFATITVTFSAGGNKVAMPEISTESDNVNDTYFDPIMVTLGCETAEASIFYTIDGTTPSDTSNPYTEPFSVSSTTTVKAIATKSGMTNSSVANKTFTFGPVFSSLEDLVAAELTKGTTVKVSFENAQITSKGTTYVYLNVKKGENNIEIYSKGNNVPATWEVGGKLSGTIIAPWEYYTSGKVWELCPTSWEGITYTEPSSEKYNITIDPNIQNGSVAVSGNITQAVEGTTITLVPTPSEHYLFDTWNVYETDNADVKITVTNNKFTMPASDVTVSATFEEIPTHAAKFFVNGVQSGETQNVYEGADVVFPTDPDAIEGYTFVGWTASPMSGVSDEAPEFVTSATMGTEDLNFYAVFATKQEGDGNYEKVTTAPADWCGKYLIVYEAGNLAFDGSLETLDAVNNTKAVTISNNVIASSQEMDAIAFTVAYKTGSSTVYSLKSASGKYISGTKSTNKAGNGLVQDVTDEDYEISFKDLTIESKSSDQQMLLKYNKASDQTRFRFYKSGQEDVALYKKHEATYSNYCTDIPVEVTITDAKYATLGLPYAVTIPEGVSAYTATVEGTTVTMTKISGGVIPAKCGVILYADVNEATNYTFTPTTDVAPIEGNKLVAVLEDYTCTGEDVDKVYYLGKDGEKAIFKKLNEDGTIAAGKAYLKLDEALSEGAKLEVTFGEPTGINTIDNGQLTIDNFKAYNLNGMRVNGSYKGIVIMNGKKYINK